MRNTTTTMKAKVYIETTVVSYLAAAPSRDVVLAGHQETTRAWWSRRDRFELFVSQAVVEEASRGNATAAAKRMALLEGIPVLGLSADIEAIASQLLRASAVPAKGSDRRDSHCGGRHQSRAVPGYVEPHAHCECGGPWQDRADVSKRGPAGTRHLYS
jgi:predicted nucleic acid-binding protein